jgi:hypothetical protein
MEPTQLPNSTAETLEAQPEVPSESLERRVINLAQERQTDIVYELLDLSEACARFRGVHAKLVYRWVREGRLHPVKPNGRRLYPSWELEALVSGRTSKPLYTYVAGAA